MGFASTPEKRASEFTENKIFLLKEKKQSLAAEQPFDFDAGRNCFSPKPLHFQNHRGRYHFRLAIRHQYGQGCPGKR
jgi:hypothetical protein